MGQSGAEVALQRQDLTLFSRFREEGLGLARTPEKQDLYSYIMYRCVVGSRAYGLDEEASNFDRRVSTHFFGR